MLFYNITGITNKYYSVKFGYTKFSSYMRLGVRIQCNQLIIDVTSIHSILKSGHEKPPNIIYDDCCQVIAC